MHPLLMGSLSWVEYQQRLQDESAIALIPSGALEQHDPHLPATELLDQVGAIISLGGDYTIAYPLLKSINQRYSRVALAHFESNSIHF
jgi:creatinine amidohydrolase/Fe(II)-dependent formamide hydrolase-like protein